MRIQFHALTRPKKAAKAISDLSGKPVMACQQAISKSCGYRDWHDLENSLLPINKVVSLDERQSHEVIATEVELVSVIAEFLNINAGDVQNALASSRLLGNCPPNMLEALEVRRRVFEAIELPPAGRRERGAIGKLQVPGRNGEQVILQEFGSPTKVLTHNSVGAVVANFEYISPKKPLPLFIPMRLYLAYGVWTEADGAKVLFSRDYKPLWRLREGYAPERIFPWLWIEHVEQSWFWDATPPWSYPEIYKMEIARLESFGIRSLPILTEALPLIIQRKEIKSFGDSVTYLEEMYLNG